ncbi:alpha/beta hydrolase [Herbaspirillum sp. 1130]|uniref:alpha/beta fold hydrolase n=1 Tax=Herbaspirillum sp. 1130 TaxID=2806562 RepID=UPI001AEB57A9|nr:alpha/beta hydrolase [Herbaspirillum sp. 1130]MBP1318286.1 pimeloyl-ACP methyl ester carboxylesterase [Herbaspirillum sp. 1130]
MNSELSHSSLETVIEGVELRLSILKRQGKKDPVVFLHGFGSTKEDFADFVLQREFDGHPFLAIDAPGCGETWCSDLSRVDIDFQVKAALAATEYLGFNRYHLVGHSMGGLGGLLLSHRYPERVLSFVNIKGNLASEDCFLSRQILDYPVDDIRRFFDDFIERARLSSQYGSALYSSSLRAKVQPEAIRGIFSSMVELSDRGDLLRKFIDLKCKKMFMYGEQYRTLSYLKLLQNEELELLEIPHCGHFPMYSAPQTMWMAISKLQKMN